MNLCERMPTECCSRQTRGFTLPELLLSVVIAVILAALVMTGTRFARDRAEDAGCLSNLRHLGVAIHTYAGDHNGFLVNNTYDSDTGKETVRWQTALDPYLEPNWTTWTKALSAARFAHAIKSVFYCPAARRPGSEVLFYGLNQELMNTAAEPTRGRLSLPSLTSPSQWVLASDTSGSGWVISSSLNKLQSVSGVTKRHDGHPNFLYADGHAESFTRELKGYLESTDPFYQALWHARYRP